MLQIHTALANTSLHSSQFATNVVQHLHRMGRCGRAGEKGSGIVFYGSEENDLVGVIRRAEEEQTGLEVAQDIEDVEGKGGNIGAAFSRNRGFRKRIRKGKQGF